MAQKRVLVDEIHEIVNGKVVISKVEKTYSDDTLISIKYYNEKGELHRGNDEPAVVSYHSKGIFKLRAWYTNGLIYRPDRQSNEMATMPAYEVYYATGKLQSRGYYNKNGMLHGTEMFPAFIEYCVDGITIKSKHWYKNDKLHRINGPAIEEYYVNSYIIDREIWYKNDLLHRDGDEPAYIAYYKWNGDIRKFKERKWYQNDKLHRPKANGPAIIRSTIDGVEDVKYYVDNILLKEEEDDYLEIIKKFSKEDIKKCIEFLKIINE